MKYFQLNGNNKTVSALKSTLLTFLCKSSWLEPLVTEFIVKICECKTKRKRIGQVISSFVLHFFSFTVTEPKYRSSPFSNIVGVFWNWSCYTTPSIIMYDFLWVTTSFVLSQKMYLIIWMCSWISSWMETMSTAPGTNLWNWCALRSKYHCNVHNLKNVS